MEGRHFTHWERHGQDWHLKGGWEEKGPALRHLWGDAFQAEGVASRKAQGWKNTLTRLKTTEKMADAVGTRALGEGWPASCGVGVGQRPGLGAENLGCPVCQGAFFG